ncbi:uncharacterized protein LOC129730305 [Wyeomyia smithii]|uniref:uncharacterized protein LOC129730305 n=1 Tax=Wyeomyia smithii TaxID=174621 RepID=UPI002467BD6D|nr:uncharacterized protein LOC129730305 [Wyeomyia smithii]
MGYGLTSKDVRSLAYKKANENGIPHPFNLSTKLSGKDWFKQFVHRNPPLTLRQPEDTSMARMKGFNRESVKIFFKLLEEAFATHNYPPSRVANMDETAVSTVPTKTNKVIAKKGERRVAGVTSAERGITTTVKFSMSASGNYLPPTFIFPRIRMQESWKCGALQDSKFLCSASGWSNMETCNTWMDHFIEHFKPTEKDPMLLILDGHTSHSRNFSMLSNTVNAFMKNNPGQVVTLNNICALVKEAFVRTATMETAENGFKATGIIPFNPNIFTSKDFAPSDALEALAHDVNEKNTPIISTRAETISSNQSSNEASLLPEDAPTAVETVDGNQICVVEGTYSDSYTVPAEEFQLCNTQVVDEST